MIEVKVQYFHRHIRNKNNDYFVYPYFMVKGHANNGASIECVRVCAGVSACVVGILRLLDSSQYRINIKSGFFEIETMKSVDNHVFIDEDTNYALNTLLCQLYDLKQSYPTQFSSFEMIEVKEKKVEKYEERKSKPKPFRELKDKRLGSSSD